MVPAGVAGAGAREADGLDEVAQAYVRVVLALGVHDSDFVDAYYGPPEWRTAAQAEKRPLPHTRGEAQRLLARLRALTPSDRKGGRVEELVLLRHEYLTRQLEALSTRVDMLSGKKLSFDEESRALYNAVAPTLADDHFDEILA